MPTNDLKAQFEDKYARDEPTIDELEHDAAAPDSCGFNSCNTQLQ
ncbi:hypothetical protein [Haladaptatus cibarius]|nr:hypothetical protein [Haladaptatus cibarius]